MAWRLVKWQAFLFLLFFYVAEACNLHCVSGLWVEHEEGQVLFCLESAREAVCPLRHVCGQLCQLGLALGLNVFKLARFPMPCQGHEGWPVQDFYGNEKRWKLAPQLHSGRLKSAKFWYRGSSYGPVSMAPAWFGLFQGHERVTLGTRKNLEKPWMVGRKIVAETGSASLQQEISIAGPFLTGNLWLKDVMMPIATTLGSICEAGAGCRASLASGLAGVDISKEIQRRNYNSLCSQDFQFLIINEWNALSVFTSWHSYGGWSHGVWGPCPKKEESGCPQGRMQKCEMFLGV